MADVFDVAEFFVQMANQSEDDQMTNLKLNKLLYYAQGAYLSRTGNPLFSNKIEAWQFGPVVMDVYQKYRVCGRNPISPGTDDVDCSCFCEEELEAMYDVMREFGRYTGSTLVTLTHKDGTPWSEAIAAQKDVLEHDSIKKYFEKHPVPRLAERLSVPFVDALPGDWYDPSEDAEWEAYL